MPRAPHPLLLIGLDGASPEVLDRLASRLPTFDRLRREGCSGAARSTEPPATFPAWTSILTGCAPEAHGVRDLLTRDGPDGALRPVSGQERLSPLIPEQLAEAGYSVACLGVPGLFPPPRCAGAWLSGFDAPGADRAGAESMFPPSLGRTIRELGGWRYATFNEQRVDLDGAVSALLDDLETKARIVRTLFNSQRWDLFFVHLQASDTVCHHLWPTWDRASPRAAAYPALDGLPRVFERLDRLVGELVAAHRGRVLLVSDHGFGGAATVAVHLNRALEDAGLLSFRSPGPTGTAFGAAASWAASTLPPSWLGALSQRIPSWVVGRAISASRQAPISDDSVAFSDELDYAPSIWLRRALDSSERARMENALHDLRVPGTDVPLIRALHWRQGSGSGPDLYVEPAWIDGYRPCFLPSSGPGPAVRELEESEWRGGRGMGMPGVHHPDGVVALHGPGIRPARVRVSLPEVGASVPTLMGLPHFEAESRHSPELSRLAGLDTSKTASREGITPNRAPAVSHAVTARLRALGYL